MCPHLQLRRVANGYEQRAKGSGLWGRQYRQQGVSLGGEKQRSVLLASIQPACSLMYSFGSVIVSALSGGRLGLFIERSFRVCSIHV